MEGELEKPYLTNRASLFVLAVITLLVCHKIFCYWLKWLETKKPFEELPMPPNSHWLFGHLKLIYQKHNFPETQYVLNSSANEHGQVGYWLGPKPTLSLAHVEDARAVLKGEHYRKPIALVSHYLQHIIGDKNILIMNGQEWKLHRGAITKTFVDSFVKGCRQDILHVTNHLINSLKQRIKSSNGTAELDIRPLMKMVTLDVFSRCAFSTDLDCCKTLTRSPIANAFEQLTNDMTERMESPLNPLNFFYWIPTERNRKQKEAVGMIRMFLDSLLSKAKGTVKSGNVRQDVLTRLLEAHKKAAVENQDEALADDIVLGEALKDVVSTLVVAGYDTTSTTLSYALYLLAKNPEMQNLCAQEVESLNDSELTDPEKLVFCSAVCQETLRLYPPGFQTSRTLTKPTTLTGGKFVVPRHTHVTVPIWVIQRDEANFPQPDEFRPDRWAKRDGEGGEGKWVTRDYEKESTSSDKNDNSIPTGNPDAVLAFSVGARSCPGAKFARQEAVIVLANLLKELKFHLVPDYRLKLEVIGVLPAPVGGIPLRMQKRQ